ncbi:MAG: hypothetical protein HZA93_23640 [Verrucomicrobia bacterium]|nr:hypothetical protein [Verrucomicrobiota bacterium]
MKPAEQSAFDEGRLGALREKRDGGYSCPYRNGPRKAAWHRGLAAGRNEISDEAHSARVAAVPEAEREANKAALKSAVEAWLARNSGVVGGSGGQGPAGVAIASAGAEGGA